MTRAEIRNAAVNQFVRQAALLEQAESEGITVSNDEVLSWISQQSQLRSGILANERARADFNAMLAANGQANGADYDRDPRTVVLVREFLTRGKLIQAHLGANASTDDLFETFVKETIAKADVRIFIDLR